MPLTAPRQSVFTSVLAAWRSAELDELMQFNGEGKSRRQPLDILLSSLSQLPH